MTKTCFAKNETWHACTHHRKLSLFQWASNSTSTATACRPWFWDTLPQRTEDETRALASLLGLVTGATYLCACVSAELCAATTSGKHTCPAKIREKMTLTARKNHFLCAVGWEDILRWNSTLKPCKDRTDLQIKSVPVIGHGIGGKDIPIMVRLAKARCWSKRWRACLSSPDLAASQRVMAWRSKYVDATYYVLHKDPTKS